MRYTLSHITRFTYSDPISEGVTELRLQPRSEASQRCLSFGVSTSPTARIFAFRDGLGNTVHYFDVPGRHEQLEIASEALVEVAPPAWDVPGLGPGHIDPNPTTGPLPGDAWERLHTSRDTGVHFDDLSPSHFALFTPALRAFHDELALPDGLDPLALALRLTQRIHALMAYNPGSTRVDSPIDEALESRRGVCQDYTHIMLALCRLRGLPARYVSGYLFTGGEGDQSSPDASHAWVEVWLPTVGWLGLDPTNNLVAGERHIRVAVGRDYADVPPVRGVFKGDAESTLHVAVQVEQAPAEPPTRWCPRRPGRRRSAASCASSHSPNRSRSRSRSWGSISPSSSRKQPMRLDYHTHHYRCGHAEGELEQYIEAAIAAGLDEIGLSDHSPIYHVGADNPHPIPRTAMSRHQMPRYLEEMLSHRGATRRRVGLHRRLGRALPGAVATVSPRLCDRLDPLGRRLVDLQPPPARGPERPKRVR